MAFQNKSDLPANMVISANRYIELYNKMGTLMTNELAEFQQLELALAPYKLSALDLNELITSVNQSEQIANDAISKAKLALEHINDTIKHLSQAERNQLLMLATTGNTNGSFDKTASTPTGTQRLNYSGYLYATRIVGVYYANSYADYAEAYDVSDECKPGDLIALNLKTSGYKRNDVYANPNVIGFVSDNFAACIGQEEKSTNTPIALNGRLRINVIGQVCKGDFLIGSDKLKGAVEYCKDTSKVAKGAIVAQALESKLYDEPDRVLCFMVRL